MANNLNKALADIAFRSYQQAKSIGNSELASHYYCQYLMHIGAA